MTRKQKLFSVLSASALMIMGAIFTSFAADGNWKLNGSTWQYVSASGEKAVDTFKKSGDYFFYLDDNGNMVKNQLITRDKDGNKFFLNKDGVMSVNRWRYLTDDEGEQNWYYFGSDGKAMKSKDKLTSSNLKTINGRKYAFDGEGRMLYGWIDENDPSLVLDAAQEGDWQTSRYYFGEENDGSAADGWRQLHVTDEDGDEHDYWFWFEDGKKCLDAKKTINGRTYSFDTTDGHMLTEWSAATSSTITPETDKIKYFDENGVQMKGRWFWAVPSEDYLESDYDDDEYSWWYAQNSGTIVKDQVKRLNGKKYAFDKYGRMLTDFVQENNGHVEQYGKAEDLNLDDLMKAKLDALYYFSSDEEHDGAMKRGYVKVDLDDESGLQFWFDNNGLGHTGYQKKIDKFTVSGIVLKANLNDSDDQYAGVAVKPEAKDEEWVIADNFDGLQYGKKLAEGSYVLINKSGFVQKNKKNLKDSETELYYETDANGYVVSVSTEKK